MDEGEFAILIFRPATVMQDIHPSIDSSLSSSSSTTPPIVSSFPSPTSSVDELS